MSSVTKQVLVKKRKKKKILPIICEFIHIFIDFCIGYIKRLYLNSNLSKQPIKVPFCRVPPKSVKPRVPSGYRRRPPSPINRQRSQKLRGVLTSFRCPYSQRPWAPSRSSRERPRRGSVLQQVSVQIHEGLIDVARYGTQRSPV